MSTYNGFITNLAKNEIFVFGSNRNGFHGAGAAGYASFGVTGNQWRKFDYGSKPDGWQGKWAVKGIGEGLQQGTDGWSYALPTVLRPGQPLGQIQIERSIQRFYAVASRYPKWRFLVAYAASGRNLNGYSSQAMADMFSSASPSSNVIFQDEFSALLKF
jgi:hypothetical protein